MGNASHCFAAIADCSGDAIVGSDLNGVIISWNKAAETIFGYTFEQVVGEPVTTIIPADRMQEDAWILDRIKHTKKVVPFETKRQCKDGRIIAVSLTTSVIRDDQNRDIGVSMIARDLTERDAREAKLQAAGVDLVRFSEQIIKDRDRARQANGAKSRFLTGMSHELRVALDDILSHAELLRSAGGLNARQDEQVDAMLVTGKRLLQMINWVLDLSEIDAEHVEAQRVDCDVQDIASACLDLVRPAVAAKNLALSIAVTPGTRRRMVTDPTRLRLVLFNLLSNATKFTSQGAIELRLRTPEDSATLRIEVTDTGPGLATDQRHRIFQDFAYPEPDIDNPIEGIGLGLALSIRLASLMGGRLGYDDNPNGGSIFWLELPLDDVAVSSLVTTSETAPPDAEPAAARPLHILVVDDMLMNRDIVGSFLSRAGHNVTYAESGSQAVAAVAGTDFDVVLMDIRMPGINGIEATRRIRTLGGERGAVPVVALTAHLFTDQMEECREAGMDEHLPKPFSQSALLATVARAARAERPDFESAHAVSASAPVAPQSGPQPQILDRDAFARTAGYLSPGSVVAHMQSITSDSETLLSDLRSTQGLIRHANEMAHAAHTLAGSAGLFGFERLADAGRQFERAVQTGAADTPGIAKMLGFTIESTLQAIQECMAHMPVSKGMDNAKQPVRILIVEDDPLQTQVLKSVLLSRGFRVDSVSSGLDAVREVRPGRYDVVLVDYQVPEINGLSIAKLLNDLMGDIARPSLIALTATPEVLNVSERGAERVFDAIVGKSSDFSSLLSVIGHCLALAPDSAALKQAGSDLLARDREDYDAVPNRPGSHGDDPGPPRILLAEDEELQRQLLTAVLQKRGYVVETVGNGLDAIRKIRAGCFDLALLDYNMPEMDGLATGALVLELMQEHLRPRLIAFTATPAQLHDKELLPGSVFDEVLAKSSDLHGLMCVVDRHLRSSPNPTTRRAAALTQPIAFRRANRPSLQG